MSYILEALKKLEQKRQYEGIPNLLTQPGDIQPVPKKRFLWPYLLIGILLLNGIIVLLALWAEPWKKSLPIPVPQSLSVRKDPASPHAIAVESQKDAPLPQTKEPTGPQQGQPPALETMKTLPQSLQSKTAHGQPPSPIKSHSESSLREDKRGKPNNKVVSIRELPPEVKNKVADLKMTVHSHSQQPHSRFVVINNTTFREGQSINAELMVEEITEKGVILNFQGHRFHMKFYENP